MPLRDAMSLIDPALGETAQFDPPSIVEEDGLGSGHYAAGARGFDDVTGQVKDPALRKIHHTPPSLVIRPCP